MYNVFDFPLVLTFVHMVFPVQLPEIGNSQDNYKPIVCHLFSKDQHYFLAN